MSDTVSGKVPWGELGRRSENVVRRYHWQVRAGGQPTARGDGVCV